MAADAFLLRQTHLSATSSRANRHRIMPLRWIRRSPPMSYMSESRRNASESQEIPQWRADHQVSIDLSSSATHRTPFVGANDWFDMDYGQETQRNDQYRSQYRSLGRRDVGPCRMEGQRDLSMWEGHRRKYVPATGVNKPAQQSNVLNMSLDVRYLLDPQDLKQATLSYKLP